MLNHHTTMYKDSRRRFPGMVKVFISIVLFTPSNHLPQLNPHTFFDTFATQNSHTKWTAKHKQNHQNVYTTKQWDKHSSSFYYTLKWFEYSNVSTTYRDKWFGDVGKMSENCSEKNEGGGTKMALSLTNRFVQRFSERI